ncbi:class I SAM-dependent methyltransferase [Nocardioides limicola]|uniref:class I SAM-dependent methyltransferase n=1 Tax=Nocardioides limicola TaxID=2803368 RepID=UPI00193B9E28|nr:class I SAM-dependent methyltransferase [Nocardioides sp. DJM-14]
MGWWSTRVVPRLVDAACAAPELDPWRQRVCAGLSGQVLEVGFGSGLNLRHLPEEVTGLAAVEPSDLGWELSKGRRGRSTVPVTRVGLDGQRLTVDESSVDAVLCTFTLCTVEDAAAVLTEIARVMAPGGRLHLLEHGLSPAPGVARWQRRLNPVQRRLCGGCQLTRDVPALLAGSGFTPVELVEQHLLRRPAPPWTWGTLAVATVTATPGPAGS